MARPSLELLAAPLTWALLLLLSAAVWPARRTRGPRLLVLAALLILLSLASGAVANALVRSLERRALATASFETPYDAAIVLSGMLDAEATETNGTPAYDGNIERLLAAYDLARLGRARFIVACGGTLDPRIHEAVEARVLARQLEDWGIERKRLLVEDQSRTTRENAQRCAPLVRARGLRRILLVTSAYHLPRAAAAFRAEGLAFDTLPVDFRGYDPGRFGGNLLPRARALAASTVALREWLGLAVYRARGWAR